MSRRRDTQIVIDACRRFNHLSDRTIARHILYTHGDLFENDLEKIRDRVRYYTGKHGASNRAKLTFENFVQKASEIKLPQTWRKTRQAYNLPKGYWLVLSDAHIPFHEPMALEAAVQYGQAEKVDGVLINGDWQDCAALSYWPTQKRDFHREIELVIDSLDWLRKEFPKQKIVYKPGNHEYRLPRYYVKNAPELIESPIAAMETIIGFEQKKIEFLDYHQLVMAGKLPIIHGHEILNLSRTVNPARGLFLRAKTFSACSHCHQTSQHSTRDIKGKLITTWSFGCVCDLNPDWNSLGNDWNFGFGLIGIEANGQFEVQNLRILPNGKVV